MPLNPEPPYTPPVVPRGKYGKLEPWLLRDYPRESTSDRGDGYVFRYLAQKALIRLNAPQRGDEWSMGLRVDTVNIEPLAESDVRNQNSLRNLAFLTVTTVSLSSGGTVTPTVRERVQYSLRWTNVDVPLEQHPKFTKRTKLPDGEFELSNTDLEHIYWWKLEWDPHYKNSWKYVKRDMDGAQISAPILIPPDGEGSRARRFIALLRRGFDLCEIKLPLWTKKSIYRGTKAPESTSIGLKETPPDPDDALPIEIQDRFEWRKEDDTNETYGDSNKWIRIEAWQGADKVWIDSASIYLDPEDLE